MENKLDAHGGLRVAPQEKIVTVHGGGLAGHGPAKRDFFTGAGGFAASPSEKKEDSREPDGPRSPRWGKPLNAYKKSFPIPHFKSGRYSAGRMPRNPHDYE